jgi:hypothetical protein
MPGSREVDRSSRYADVAFDMPSVLSFDKLVSGASSMLGGLALSLLCRRCRNTSMFVFYVYCLNTLNDRPDSKCSLTFTVLAGAPIF